MKNGYYKAKYQKEPRNNNEKAFTYSPLSIQFDIKKYQIIVLMCLQEISADPNQKIITPNKLTIN